ncbi:4-hydroxy-tetrahydrodipicolinate reductase [Oceanirhabdus sp. W0125-5]|uniref:4-hydroxy-tetrahydrodipicolinate reductase n=1 Tax=Oceanirhabdus sp. W0125-5 TaxID=2999116 RepID=UPI0022F3443A|nr:4-hydroxy-tetrahydrodipicolinate reductase [Oceanirhabdus sp. W0125-5]WBW99380.1 4-hydroxy-tetrahydrodipicolinate reductase [Oceanirhabdus sp. W0125-5]
MINTLIVGCNGTMGKVLIKECTKLENIEIVAGFDKDMNSSLPFPVYSNFEDIKEDIDVIIDFSNPVVLESLLKFCVKRKLPLVLCTTGFSDAQIKEIESASSKTPIFFSANMSLGINLIKNLLIKATKVLYDGFDIEIIEKHHNKKVDSPSGTAYLLGDAIMDSIPEETEYVHGREGYHKREKKEIGMHSLRGGTIVGEHEVIFAGNDEIISVKHEALSKNIFAMGAFKAAKYIVKQEAGLYDMDDMLNL